MKRVLELALGVALASAFLTGQAYAYLDAGSVSMALQVVIGAVASALVIVKVYFSRFLNFFRRGTASAEARSDVKNG